MELMPATARLLETVQEMPERPGGQLLNDLAAGLSLAPAALRAQGCGRLAAFAAPGGPALARDGDNGEGDDGDIVLPRPQP